MTESVRNFIKKNLICLDLASKICDCLELKGFGFRLLLFSPPPSVVLVSIGNLNFGEFEFLLLFVRILEVHASSSSLFFCFFL